MTLLQGSPTALFLGGLLSLVCLSPLALAQAPRSTAQANIQRWGWCQCLGIECTADPTETDTSRTTRMNGFWDRIHHAVETNPTRYLPNENRRSVATIVSDCLAPSQREPKIPGRHASSNTPHPGSWYLTWRLSRSRAYQTMALSMFPVSSIVMISREVANSSEGRIPRRPGVRVVQGCRGELILQIRDDLSLQEIQRIFENIPLLANIRFDNPLLRVRHASVPAPATDPDAAVSAAIINPSSLRSCSGGDLFTVNRSSLQAGLWDFTSTGWEAADERGLRNTFPQRYLPQSCRETAERRGPRRIGRPRPDANLAPIRTLAEYRAFLRQLEDLDRSEERCNEQRQAREEAENAAAVDAEISSQAILAQQRAVAPSASIRPMTPEEVSNLPRHQESTLSVISSDDVSISHEDEECPQSAQMDALAAGLRNRLSLQRALAFENSLANDRSLTMPQRINARVRSDVYSSSWRDEETDESINEDVATEQVDAALSHEATTKLEMARYCAGSGYCDCVRSGFDASLLIFVEQVVQDGSGEPSFAGAPVEMTERQQEEFNRLIVQIYTLKNEFHRLNSVDPDTDEGVLRLDQLCHFDNPNPMEFRFGSPCIPMRAIVPDSPASTP